MLNLYFAGDLVLIALINVLKKYLAYIPEALLAMLTLLSIVVLCLDFYYLQNPDNPFKDFDSNAGVVRISIASLVMRSIFLLCFLLLLFDKYKLDKSIKIVYLISALIIGFLQWYKLYYGSTFYYGEIRDKQGLMFPFLASFMATLVIWKLDYSATESRNLIFKLMLTGLLNIGPYLLWTQVYESWKLWQS